MSIKQSSSFILEIILDLLVTQLTEKAQFMFCTDD